MKKVSFPSLRHLFALCALLIGFSAYGQVVSQITPNGIFVGNRNTTTSISNPFASYNRYAYGQMVFTADELSPMTITGITLYMSSENTTTHPYNLVIYLGEVSRTSFSGTYSDYVPLSSLTQVYSGSGTYPVSDSLTILFDTPFSYTGTNSLVLAVDLNQSSSNLVHRFKGYPTSKRLPYWRRNTDIDPASPPSSAFYSDGQVYFNLCFVADLSSCQAPSGVASELDSLSRVRVYWNGDTSNLGYQIEYGPQGFTLGQGTLLSTTATSVVIDSLPASTTFDLYVRALCDSADTSRWSAPYSFSIDTGMGPSLPDNFIYIGDSATSNATGSYPYDNLSNYSWVQMIYPADSLGGAGDISDIAFSIRSGFAYSFPVDNLRIYMGHTAMNSHNSPSNWIPLSDLTLAYSASNTTIGSPAGWESVHLDTPFPYDGSNNLAIVVAKSSSAWYWNPEYRYLNPGSGYMTLYAESCDDTTYAHHPGSNIGIRDYNLPVIRIAKDTGSHCPAVPAASIALRSASDTLILSWSAPDSSVSGYNILYGPTNFDIQTQGTLVTGIVDTFALITGLTGGTGYDFYVQSLCDSASTPWARLRSQCIPIIELPFEEDFESYPISQLTGCAYANSCWQGNTWSWGGTYNYIYSNNTQQVLLSGRSLLSLPQLGNNFDIQQLELSFDIESIYSDINLRIGVMTDPADTNTFTTIHRISQADTTRHTIQFDSYYGFGRYIAFFAADGSYLHLDNIRLRSTDYCNPPVNIHFHAVADTQCLVVWNHGIRSAADLSGAHVASYTAAYGPYDQFNIDDSSTYQTLNNIADTTILLTALTPSSHYQVAVRALSDSGLFTPWTLSHGFYTSCTAIPHDSLPWVEDYSDWNLSQFPLQDALSPCWTLTGTDISRCYLYSRSNYMSQESFDYVDLSNYIGSSCLALPLFADDVRSLQLSFSAINGYPYNHYSNVIEVGVMDDPHDYSTFTTLFRDTLSTQSWQQYSVPLHHYAGTGRFIALRAPHNYTASQPFNIRIADFQVATATFSVSVASSDTLLGRAYILDPHQGTTTQGRYSYGDTLILQAEAAQNKDYRISHRFAGWADGDTANPRIVVIQSDTHFISHFVADTIPTYVASVVSSDTSLGTVGIINLDLSTAEVYQHGTFDEGTPLQFTAYPAPEARFVSWSDGIEDNPRTVVLESDTILVAQFQEGGTDGIEPVEAEEEEGARIIVAPNPATEAVVVHSQVEMTQIEIYALDGRKVREVQVAGTQAEVEVSHLRSGTYLLKVHTATGSAPHTQKLVVTH